MRRISFATAVFVVALTTAACTSDSTSTSSRPSPSSSAAPSVTGPAAIDPISTGAPVPGEPAFSVARQGTFPSSLTVPGSADGSGCSPGPGDLPDGVWFGSPAVWTATSMDVDLLCFYSGDAATAEASARGEESPPPNDYLITNDNPTLRALPVAPDAIGYRLDGNAEFQQVPFADFIVDPGMFQACPDFCIVWIYVNDGQVTEVVSQFVP